MNKSQEKVISTLLTAVVATTGVAVATGSPVKAATKTSQTQLLKNAKFAVERAEASVNKAYVDGMHATPKLDYIVAAQNAVRRLSSSATKTSYAQRTSRAMSKAVQQLSQLTASVGTLSKDKDVVKVFIDFARHENQYVPFANLKTTFEARLAKAEAALADDPAEVAAEAAAETAVAAYEKAPLTSLTEATAAEALEASAKTAVAAVKDTAKNTVFTSRIAAQKAKVDAAKASFASLAVSSVTALNATQLQVVFNKAVDTASAQTVTNYKVGADNPNTAVLQADGKTVILTFASATTLTGTSNAGTSNAAVVIEPVTSATDSYTKSARYVTLLTYKDSAKPAIASIASTTNTSKASSVTVNFTEPISSLGSIKIDGTGVTGVWTDATHTAATFTTDLDATAAHSIQFFGLTDMVGNVADLFTQSFNITVDKAIPTATVAPSTDIDNAFVLTFNKDMDSNSVKNAAVRVLDESLQGTFGNVSVTQPDATNKKVYLVKGDGTIFGTKSSRTFTVVLPATITDTLGNTFAATTTTVTLTKDTVKPAISDVKVVKDPSGNVTKIVLTANTTLKTASLSNLSIVDSNGVLCTGTTALGTLSISPAVTVGDKTVTVVPQNSVPLTGKYTFNFAAGTLSDQAETANTSDAVSQVVDFGTASTGTGTFTIPAAKLTSAALQPAATSNTYTVDFGTAVKGGAVAGSATDASKYTINGNALPTGTTITLDSAKQVATITVPAGSIAKTDTAAILYIAGVQDASGNTVVPVTAKVQINDNIKPVVNSAVLNSDNTVTFGISEAVTAPAYTTDLVVNVNGTPVTGLAVQSGNGTDAGKYLVTGLGALEKYDGTSKTYLDLNNNNTIDTGDIVLSTAGGDKTGTKLTDFSAVTSLTVTSVASPTAKDAANNTLTGSTTLTIK